MKLLFITPEYPTLNSPEGGLANYVRKISVQLHKAGHTVNVLTFGDPKAIYIDCGIQIYYLRRIKILPSIFYRTRLSKFLTLINSIIACIQVAFHVYLLLPKDYSLIQVSSYQYLGLFLFPVFFRCPIICRISSLNHLLRHALAQPNTIFDICQDKLELLQIKLATKKFAPSQFIVTACQKKQLAVDLLRTPIESIGSTKLDYSIYRQSLKDKSYLLIFGTLNRVKGTDLLAKPISIICKRYPKIHFVFVGRDDGIPGFSRTSDYLYQLNPKHASHLHFISPLPKTMLYPLIKQAQAVIIPSRVDNYPNACLETMQLGTPIIASTDSSLDELVLDRQNGLLFRNGDEDDLSKTLIKFLKLPKSTTSAMKKANHFLYRQIINQDRFGQLLKYYQYAIDKT